MIQQAYCQTAWGRVCYWSVAHFLPRDETPSNPVGTNVIVFLHGLGGSGRYWTSYLEELALHPLEQRNMIAIAPDLLGFGASDKPHVEYTAELQLSVIQSVLSQYFEKLQLTRLMLSYAPVCQVVHYSLKTLWPLVLFLVARGVVKTALPLPVVVDYMQHTCHSYTSNARQIVFQTNLDPSVQTLQQYGPPPSLLIYSRVDTDAPWQHGQELAQHLKKSKLELLEKTSHVDLGQAALHEVLAFLQASSH